MDSVMVEMMLVQQQKLLHCPRWRAYTLYTCRQAPANRQYLGLDSLTLASSGSFQPHSPSPPSFHYHQWWAAFFRGRYDSHSWALPDQPSREFNAQGGQWYSINYTEEQGGEPKQCFKEVVAIRHTSSSSNLKHCFSPLPAQTLLEDNDTSPLCSQGGGTGIPRDSLETSKILRQPFPTEGIEFSPVHAVLFSERETEVTSNVNWNLCSGLLIL